MQVVYGVAKKMAYTEYNHTTFSATVDHVCHCALKLDHKPSTDYLLP